MLGAWSNSFRKSSRQIQSTTSMKTRIDISITCQCFRDWRMCRYYGSFPLGIDIEIRCFRSLVLSLKWLNLQCSFWGIWALVKTWGTWTLFSFNGQALKLIFLDWFTLKRSKMRRRTIIKIRRMIRCSTSKTWSKQWPQSCSTTWAESKSCSKTLLESYCHTLSRKASIALPPAISGACSDTNCHTLENHPKIFTWCTVLRTLPS